MAKKKLEIALEPHPWEDSTFVEWISRYMKEILYGLGILAIALFFLFRFFNASQTQAENQFLQAEDLGAKLNDPFQVEDTINTLQPLLKKHPELYQKYDGPIAQSLLLISKPQEAIPYMERNFSRVSTMESTHHQKSQEITKLVSQNQIEQAYQKGLMLKEEMKAEASQFAHLYLYNLVRLAFMEQALGLKKQEAQSWQDFLNISKKGSLIPQQTYDEFVEAWSMNGISLINYIQDRQKKLKKT